MLCRIRSPVSLSYASASDAVSRVFVSHSHQDDDYRRAFVHELRAAGVDVWYNEHNLTSGQLLTDMQRELHARHIFVPILSKAALHESTWVKNECMWAFTLYSREPGRTFLPVTGAPIEQSDFGADWLFLEGFKRIEAPKLLPYPPQEAARRMLNAIGHVVPEHDRFPKRLAELGFISARSDHGVEYILPPLYAVPAGPFLMGSDPRRDPQAFADEQPQHSVMLPAYQIARFPSRWPSMPASCAPATPCSAIG